MRNQDIRCLICRSEVNHKTIAEHMGISERTLFRWLSREMTENQKQKIRLAVNQTENQSRQGFGESWR